MELNNLRPAAGSVKTRKRVARGQGSGRGGTSTRGHKGAKSRSGYSRKLNFEGGQMPLQMRLPKRGFKNPNRVVFVPMNVGQLEAISKKHGVKELSTAKLYELGYIKKTDKVKVLGNGELNSALTLTVNAISNKGKELVEAKGGSVTLL